MFCVTRGEDIFWLSSDYTESDRFNQIIESELDLAIEVARDNNHTTLHFGINGYFLYSE